MEQTAAMAVRIPYCDAWLVPPLKMYYELNCSHYITEFFKVYAAVPGLDCFMRQN